MKKLELNELKGLWNNSFYNQNESSYPIVELIIKDRWLKRKKEDVIGTLNIYRTNKKNCERILLEETVDLLSEIEDGEKSYIRLGGHNIPFLGITNRHEKATMKLKLNGKIVEFNRLSDLRN